jgi:hypothetical protein
MTEFEWWFIEVSILNRKADILFFGLGILSVFASVTAHITAFSTPMYIVLFIILLFPVWHFKIKRNGTTYIVLLLILLTLIRIPDVVNYKSYSYFFQFLIHFIIFLFFSSRKYSNEDIRYLIKMYIYSGVLISLCVLILGKSYSDGSVTRHLRYSYGFINIIEVNHLATYIASTFIFSYYKFLKKDGNLISLIIILCGVYRTGSRSAFLSVILGAIVISVLMINNKKNRNLYYVFFIFVVIMVFILLPTSLKNRYLNMNSYSDGSNGTRILLWINAIDVFSRRPLFGYGPINTGIINMHVNKFDHVAHNSYLGVLIQYGIIGLIMFMMIPINLLIRAIKRKNILIVAAIINIGFSCMIIETQLNMALWITLIISSIILSCDPQSML